MYATLDMPRLRVHARQAGRTDCLASLAAGFRWGTRGAARSLRALAATGELWRVAAASPDDLARLRSEAFDLALPLVWQRHTRPLEIRKGHWQCARAVFRMRPECADGFTADLEAVVAALMSYRQPISSLEGWITRRMANAIKDGYRVRRAAEMGAQQRVRVPGRLAAGLGGNAWLITLADRVLQWAGVRYAAGAGLWPLGAWAEERSRIMGPSADPAAGLRLAAEVDAVLTAMKRWDAAWYEKYVERPLGRKWAPVFFDNRAADNGADPADELGYLELVPRHERDDARLAEAASVSLEIIGERLAAGDEPWLAVTEALTASYLSVASVRDEMDREPNSGAGAAEVVQAVLADPEALSRVVRAAVEIVGERRAHTSPAEMLIA